MAKEKLWFIRNRRGAVDPALLLSMLLCVGLIIILIVSIFNLAVSGSIKNAGYIARDAGSLIEVADSAPETLRASYRVEFGTDKFPKAGSFLLSKDNEVCVSPHSEDEMFMIISEAAMSGWLGTVAAKTGYKFQRKWKFRGIRWIGRRLPGARVAKLAGGVIKKVGIKIGSKIIKSAVAKKIKTWAAKKFTKQAAIQLGRKLIRKVGRYIVTSIGRGSSMAFTGEATQELWCGPVPCGRIAAYAMAIAMFALDYAWTIAPMIMMVRMGHSASDREFNDVKCYKIIADEIYAEPPNCETKIEKLEVKELGGDYTTWLPGWIEVPLVPTCDFDKPVTDFKNRQGGIESKSDFCYSCPNYFVSQPDADITQTEITFGKEIGEGMSMNLAGIILVGPRFACAAVTAARPSWGGWCSFGYFIALMTALYERPAWFVNMFTGSNILPRDEYYYMAFPSRIDVERVYDIEKGNSELTIIHAE